MATTNLAHGIGRRKTAVARVYLRQGSGDITVNGRNIDEFFFSKEQVIQATAPLLATGAEKSYNILVNVSGGGVSGQAGAVRLGIARALLSHDKTNYETLKANGFLTRDPRMVERKKYGRPKARKKFQFSKR